MIIFDLDGTLADCEHRRHFVDPKKDINVEFCEKDQCYYYNNIIFTSNPTKKKHWKPDWQAFYEACDKDTPNIPIITLLRCLYLLDNEIEIWSGRCESVRDKTIKWLEEYVIYDPFPIKVKMRPIGDSTPDDQLKQIWLDEHFANGGEPILMVFDDRKKVVDMWRRRGITCLQVAEGNF